MSRASSKMETPAASASVANGVAQVVRAAPVDPGSIEGGRPLAVAPVGEVEVSPLRRRKEERGGEPRRESVEGVEGASLAGRVGASGPSSGTG
jgi:hypothetical protein